jgi:hypothetical protein
MGSAFALMIAAAIKTLAMISIAFNKPMKKDELDKLVDKTVLMLG